jgi:glycosyltransferase involved in cell wall biosynthesis
VILDSGSTDDTVELATGLGATVYVQEWLGWSAQRNRAISLASNDWVFCIDCDEIVTPELARLIQKVMASDPDPRDGFAVDRRGDFLGILLPSTTRKATIKNYAKIFHRKFSGYDSSMLVHEEVRLQGRIHVLNGVLIHWRGYVLDEYVTVFNRYATVEATVLNKNGVRATFWLILVRPMLRFFWAYIAKREYRLGARGLIHAMLKATSEFIRYAKLWEMQNASKAIHPSLEIYAPDSLNLPRVPPVTK